MLFEPNYITESIVAHQYPGAGTQEDPFLVSFLNADPRDPMQFSLRLRWMVCIAAGFSTFSVAFISSAYASGIPRIAQEFGASIEVATMGLSLFLTGFVLGPLVWAPGSEMFGRQRILVLSAAVHVAVNIAICFSPNLTTLLSLRFLSGAFGAAPLSNSGAVIADTFPANERGLAVTVYALVPLFAPLTGPLVGEYVAGTFGWRWLMGMMAVLSASALVIVLVCLPETYAPVLLQQRAQKLSQVTNRVYISELANKQRGTSGLGDSLSLTILLPFRLAIHEPILLLMAIFQAIVFGTLYLTFAAFPMVYTELRGWPQEQSGLAFVGVLVGFFFSIIFQLWDNRRYVRIVEKMGQSTTPEHRLPGSCIGVVSIVLGLLLFAWTASPEIPWMVNAAAGIPFGFGIVLVTISSTNYLIDTYTMLAASALTVCICSRAIFSAAFPLFVRGLLAHVGVYWGLSLPGFLALICTPVPFVFYYYGSSIRERCKYAGLATKRGESERGPITERTLLLSAP